MRGLRQLIPPRCTWLIAGGAVAVHLMAATAWAQRHARVPKDESGMLPWGIAAGLAVVICVSAFLNPKRSHLT